MTWIPDLSHHGYITAGPFVRSIGWLSREHPFPTGPVPAPFLARLTEMARRADVSELAYGFGHFMGMHACDLCPPDASGQGRAIHHSGVRNFAVPFPPLLFVCPELVDHYVRDHDYRPPDEFIEAVLDAPLPEPREGLVPNLNTATETSPASPLEQYVRLREAMDATPYGRVAAIFRARFATLGALDGAVTAAAARNWTVKGRCPRCSVWNYGHDTLAPCCGEALVDVETRIIGKPARTIVIVMGVSGAGKSTVGQLLAQRAVWIFRDADDYHSPSNVAKMRRGEALTDDDRARWAEELHGLLAHATATGRSLVLACSALKAKLRARLAEGIPGVRFVYLRVGPEELRRRLAGRSEHFFAPVLLDSQLAALEEPDDAIVVDGTAAPEVIVETIAERLSLELAPKVTPPLETRPRLGLNEAMPWKHAIRDLAFVLVTLGLWRVDAALRQESGLVPILVALAAGLMAAFAGYLAHEWGHFLAARAGGSIVRIPASPASIFLFNFDSDRNSREQFLLMSSGGFLASGLVIAFFLAVLPLPSLSSLVALGLSAAGVVATAILEVPPFLRVFRGGPIPRGGAYASGSAT